MTMAKRSRRKAASGVSVKFLRDTLPREGGEFAAGQEVEMSEVSAARWIRRKAAMLCDIQSTLEPKPEPIEDESDGNE
jgi:hypothetical protein